MKKIIILSLLILGMAVYANDENIENIEININPDIQKEKYYEQKAQKWQSYIEEFEKQAKANWNPVKSEKEYAINVILTVDKNGKILDKQVATVQENKEAIEAVLNAIEKGAPYKPFPKNLVLLTL